MSRLRNDVKDYFKKEGTVSKWWNPETGKLKFHYDKEIKVLDENFQVDPNWRVLDVGTGRGRFAIWFAKKGCKVTALDISEEMLKIAKKNARKEGAIEKIDFFLGDAENLSDFEQEFNIICCMELFDHLPNTKKAVREMTNKLLPGGYFLFTYVSEDSIYWKLTKRDQVPDIIDISKAYKTENFLKIIKDNNIKIKNLFGIGLLFPVRVIFRFYIPIWICKLEKLLKPYYCHPYFIRGCTHVLGWGKK